MEAINVMNSDDDERAAYNGSMHRSGTFSNA